MYFFKKFRYLYFFEKYFGAYQNLMVTIYDIWYAQYQDYQMVRWVNDLYNNYEIALYALPFTCKDFY